MNSEWLQIVRHSEQSEGSLLCGRTHESPSPPALSHRREREPVEEYGSGQWRTLETSTHKPGALGSLVHKRVYTHTNGDATPDAYADYTYGYDAVGNVYCVWDDDGNEVFYFAQDAFGNELPVDLYGQDSWSTARTLGITEHQTGKWIDPFTGLYYFSARWYDSGVGRFVGRDPLYFSSHPLQNSNSMCCGGNCGLMKGRSPNDSPEGFAIEPYGYTKGNPLLFVDPTGLSTCFNAQEIEGSKSWWGFSFAVIYASASTNFPCPGKPSKCTFIAYNLGLGIFYPGWGGAYRKITCCKPGCECVDVENEYGGAFLGSNVMAGGGIGGAISLVGNLTCQWEVSIGWQLGAEVVGFSDYIKLSCTN